SGPLYLIVNPELRSRNPTPSEGASQNPMFPAGALTPAEDAALSEPVLRADLYSSKVVHDTVHAMLDIFFAASLVQVCDGLESIGKNFSGNVPALVCCVDADGRVEAAANGSGERMLRLELSLRIVRVQFDRGEIKPSQIDLVFADRG